MDQRHPDVEQVWFSGVHSSVGGGSSETRLSDLALGGMAEKATANGLEFKSGELPPPPPDHLQAPIPESRIGIYKYLMGHKRKLGVNNSKMEALHPTAEERHDSSAPNDRSANVTRPVPTGPQDSR